MENAGHRERLRTRLLTGGGKALADYEVIECLLFSAHKRRDTKPIAKALIKKFGSFGAVMAASPQALKEVEGVGDSAVASLKIVREAALRMAREEIIDKPLLSNWETMINYCRMKVAHARKEEFHLLFLDRRGYLIHEEQQQTGTVDHTPVYPREILERTIQLNASSIILLHNHPSGDPTPSRADIELTKAIIRAGATMNITVHDHVIIGKYGFSTLKSKGII